MFWKRLVGTTNDKSAEEVRSMLAEQPAESVTVLDVRTREEYEKGHLPGAKLVPISELAERLDEVDRSKPIVTY
jgi:rhodanese-related sulfurtransferase